MIMRPIRDSRLLRGLCKGSLLAIGLASSGIAIAECSADYHGLATINEVFKLGEGAGDNKRFIEIKVLTSSITAAEYNQWTVRTCAAGQKKKDPDVCSAAIPLADGDDSTYPWIVVDGSEIPVAAINLQEMDIVLSDGNGNTIDYLSIDGFNEQEDNDCVPAYDWEFEPRNGNSTKNVKRRPDGIGDWEAAPGNSDGDSRGTTNDDGPAGPDISINSATVFPGDTAEFTVTLAAAADQDITVDFATREDTAEEGKDYEGRSGTVTIPAGQTNVTISVPTLVSGDRVGKRFFLELSDPSAGQLASQLGVGYILPEPNGYWRLESPGWSGSGGEVVDFSGNDLGGRAVNGTRAQSGSPALANNPGTCGYADFNGVDQYIEIPDDNELDLKEELTVSAWFNARELPSGSGLKTLVSKDENYGIHLNASGEIYWSWQTDDNDAGTLITSGASVSPDTWHHVAITYADGRQRIYVDGQLRASSDAAGTLERNNDPFQIGQDQGYSGRYFNGFIDEVRVYETELPADAVEALRARRHVCASSVAELRLPTPQTASVCKPLTLILSARDQDGDLVEDYDGTVQLSTSSSHGNWSLVAGSGTLNSAGNDDGQASYQFSVADGGDVSLGLSNSHPDRLTITALDTDSDVVFTTPVIEFLSSSLLIGSADSLGDDIIAGRRHQLSVSLVRQDPDDGSCGVDTGYEGVFSLKAWLTRSANDPDGEKPDLVGDSTLSGVPDSEPGGGNLDLRFVGGVAAVALDTSDVGAYGLNLMDEDSGYAVDEEGDPIAIGSSLDSSPWVVRPFAFSVQATDADGGAVNPGASDATGPTFITAGSPLDLTVTARLYQSADDADGDGVADDGALLTDNPAAKAFGSESTDVSLTPSLRLPSGGFNPSLSGDALVLDDFKNGATDSEYRFNEVGIIDVEASVDGNDYLGMGAARTSKIRGDSGAIGRFYPADLRVTLTDAGEMANTCTSGATSFSYIGQALDYHVAPEFTVEPVAENGVVTQNYRGDFRHLEPSEISFDYPSADGDNALSVTTAAGAPTLSENGDGTLSLVMGADQFTYVKDVTSRVAPFTSSLTVTVTGISETLDGISSSSVPVSATPLGALLRYGRLRLDNTYGPETDTLIVPMQLEYFDGSAFVLNSDDSCWVYDTGADASVSPAGLTSVQGVTDTVSAGTPPGSSRLLLASPGEGNTGEVTVEYAVPDWLQDDVDGDGTLDLPSALATFGVYRGHDRVIYWQER